MGHSHKSTGLNSCVKVENLNKTKVDRFHTSPRVRMKKKSNREKEKLFDLGTITFCIQASPWDEQKQYTIQQQTQTDDNNHIELV